MKPSIETEKRLRNEVTGNFCALGIIPIADSNHKLVEKYMDLMKPTEVRRFYSYEYVLNCLMYAKECFKFDNPPFAIATILFHKIGHLSGDRGSLRRTCELTLDFYQGAKTVELISMIKAAQTRMSLISRYGDDRDAIADIANHIYGTTEYDSFKKACGQILVEFSEAKIPPKVFKRWARMRLRRLLRFAQWCGIYHTHQFDSRFNNQAISNISRLLEEI